MHGFKTAYTYLHCFSVGDFFENPVVDFHDLVPHSEPLFLRQAPRLHQGHVDPDPMLGTAADAESQALVALVPLHGDLPQLPRRFVDEVPPEQGHQRSCPVAAGAEAIRRALQRHLEITRIRCKIPRKSWTGGGQISRRGFGAAVDWR